MTQPRSPFRSPLALLLFFGVTVVGVGLDLWNKNLAVEHLKDGPMVQFVPNWLNLTYTENRGAVFGLGQGQRWLFVGVSIFAIAVLTSLFSRSAGRSFYQWLLGMLLAGVLGNMYDRITLGYVRDMIYALPDWKNPLRGFFPAWQTVFPWIFNVADSLLCVGVFLMIVYSFTQKPQQHEGDLKSQSPDQV